MKHPWYDIIREPLITEKITRQTEKMSKYAFRVDRAATKKTIKVAIERIFNVHVARVHTSNFAGKWKRVRFRAGKTADWKKAVVTLKQGEKIDITA